MNDLTPEHWRDIAAMNARTYAMSEEERTQWYRDHPVSDFGAPVDTMARRARNRAAEAASDAAECIALGRYDDARDRLTESGRHLDRLRGLTGSGDC